MNLDVAPDPAEFGRKLAEMHRVTSPNVKFGFPVPIVIGRLQKTDVWEESWARSFTHLLDDVMQYDREANGVWPELDAAYKQLVDVVIHRLLGVLQCGGRQITPALVHGDIWKNNIGLDMESGKLVVFDPGCVYAHNEMEFGTWRCTWAYHFASPTYISP
jgi:protein-ribulosamine 3-kinase